MKRIAIIPARSGSKGLRDKNIRPLGGIPLMAYSIQAALESGLFSRVVVSTDSAEYADTARRWGAEPMMRPARLADDRATTFMVIEDLLQQLPERYDELVLLQPTSPLRNATHVKEAVALLEDRWTDFDFLVSVKPAETPAALVQPIDEDSNSLSHFTADFSHYHRQDEHDYSPNGAIFIAKPEAYLRQQHFFGPSSLAYRMTAEDSVDIDTPLDMLEAEALVAQNPYRQVAIIGTAYTLFYYLLLAGEGALRHTFFVLADSVPAALRQRIPHTLVKNRFGQGLLRKTAGRLADALRLMARHHAFRLTGLPIWGHDHLPASLYYLNCRRESFTVVEDGLHNYLPIHIHVNRWLRPLYRLLPLGPTGQPFGHDRRVERICLTGLAPIPDEIKSKTEVNDLVTLWQAATPEYRLRLIHLFDIPVLPVHAGPYHLLVTQPFAEDGRYTEDEKQACYRRAMAPYAEETLLIKPHPRETADYRRLYPRATVLGPVFPIEVLAMLYAPQIADMTTVDSSCIGFFEQYTPIPVRIFKIQE